MGIRVFYRSNLLKSINFLGLHQQQSSPARSKSLAARRRLAPAVVTIIALTIVSIGLGFGWYNLANRGELTASSQGGGHSHLEKNSQAPSLTIPRAADATNVTDYAADFSSGSWYATFGGGQYYMYNAMAAAGDTYTDMMSPAMNYGNYPYVFVEYAGDVERGWWAQPIHSGSYLYDNLTSQTTLMTFIPQYPGDGNSISLYKTIAFNENNITWSNQPNRGTFYPLLAAWTNSYPTIVDIGWNSNPYVVATFEGPGSGSMVRFASKEAGYQAYTDKFSKMYVAAGKFYAQTNVSEMMTLASPSAAIALPAGDTISLNYTSTTGNPLTLQFNNNGVLTNYSLGSTIGKQIFTTLLTTPLNFTSWAITGVASPASYVEVTSLTATHSLGYVPPQLTSPPDQFLQMGTTGNTISWTVSNGLGTGQYNITFDNTIVQSGSWMSGQNITVSIDGLTGGYYTCALAVTDSLGVFASDSVIVMVHAPPVLTSPSDVLYQAGTTGNNITWIVTDNTVNGTSYSIMCDGTPVQNGTWASGQEIIANIDGLAVGTQTYMLTVNDGFGGISSDAVLVTVNGAPILTSPADVLFQYGTTGHRITWTVADGTTNCTWYDITCNGAEVQNGTWASGQNFTVNLDALAPGSYTFVLTVVDGLGGSASDAVLVTVNGVPQLSRPADFYYQFGITGHDITWVVTDGTVNGTSYILTAISWTISEITIGNTAYRLITQNSTVVQTGSWTSGQNITISVDGLAAGTYTYLLAVTDGLGGAASDAVLVTVNSPPQLISPTDITYYEGASGNFITWLVSDATTNGSWFSIMCNGTLGQTGPWTSGQNITVGVDGLAAGTYQYILTVYDGFETSASDNVIVTVLPNQAPVLTSPNDITYISGNSGNSITWEVTDQNFNNPTYAITRNGIVVQNGTWVNGQNISITVDGLTPGSYIYILTAFNGLGTNASDVVVVTVLSNAAPVLTSPGNVTYVSGMAGNLISWTVSDGTTGSTSYAITLNGTVIQSGAWSNGQTITINVDGLAAGSWVYTITVSDGLGANASDTVLVTVLPNAAPVLSAPGNVTYVSGATGNTITWTVSDSTTGSTSYAITQNGTVVQIGAWSNGQNITVNVDGLAAGSWVYTITVSDGLGANSSDLVVVAVAGNFPPQLTSPPDFLYENGTAGHAIVWTVTDGTVNNPTYVILQNGTLVQSGAWVSGLNITQNADGLAPGYFGFTITVWDGYGDSASDTALVTVNAPPKLTSPANIIYQNATTGHSISWTVTDLTTGSTAYTIKRNSTTVQNGTWATGQNITVSVDGLAPGHYGYTITVSDGYGDSTNNTVLVTVNAPPKLTTPANILYESGTTGHWVNWTVTSTTTSNPTFTVTCNGTTVQNGTWVTGQKIAQNVDGLAPGYYGFTITVWDGYGDSASDTALVSVNAPPQLTSPADIIYENATTGHSISWTVTDLTTGSTTYTIKRNSTTIQNGTWVTGQNITISVDGLAPGRYGYTLTVLDGYGDTTSDTVLVTVNAPPKLTNPANVTYKVGTTGHWANWTVTDTTTSNPTFAVTCNGTMVQNGTWVTGQKISQNVDSLAVGTYIFVLTVWDGYGDSTSSTVVVTVNP